MRQDPADDVTQLAVGVFRVGQRLGQQIGDVTSADGAVSGQLQGDDRVDQPLLSAVVDVALQATACVVRGRDDARA